MGYEALGLVVHGIGDQKKGDALRHTVESFLPLVRERIDPGATVTVTPLDADGPAEVTFQFLGPSGETAARRSDQARTTYRLTFREVWWAQSFRPPALTAVITGLVRGAYNRFTNGGEIEMSWWYFILRAAWEVVTGLLLNVLKIVALALFLVVLVVVLAARALGAILPHVPVVGGAKSFVPVGKRRTLKRFLYDAQNFLLGRAAEFQAIVVIMAVIFLAIPALILLLVLVLLTPLPDSWLPAPASKMRSLIAGWLTGSAGDMITYLNQPWEAAQIRACFEASFQSFISDHAEHLDDVEAVMVIAHSMGSVVAYEALTGDNLRLDVQRFAGASPPLLTFVSIGSALNLSWDSVPPDESARICRPLPASIDWLNIWAQYDPVGGLPLRLSEGTYESRESTWTRGYMVPLSQREVVNQMDLFSDHSAYWNNVEEVIAPLLNVLTRDSLAEDLATHPAGRRQRVQVLAAIKAVAWLMPWLAFPAALVIGAADIFDFAEARVRDTWDCIEPVARWLDPPFIDLHEIAADLGDKVPGWARDIGDWFWRQRLDSWFGAIYLATICGMLGAVLYSGIGKRLWNQWDNARRFDFPPPSSGKPIA